MCPRPYLNQLVLLIHGWLGTVSLRKLELLSLCSSSTMEGGFLLLFEIALVLQGLDSKLSEISTFGIASGCKKVLEALLESAKGPDVDPSEQSRISTS